MPRRRNRQDIVKNKTYDGVSTRTGMNYMPPGAWKNLTNGEDESSENLLDESLLRQLISEIIRKCGKEWCLFTKSKDRKTGKRRRLGTHSSKESAQRQERAIKYHGG